MKVLYLDPFSGASGDMFLGLLIDLGVDPTAVETELRKLSLTGWSLAWEREERRGITGTRAVVVAPHEHHHRSWREIDRMLGESVLTPAVRELSQRIFRRLAVAEAKVHGVTPEEVHFHEVGALDSIVDIVGAAAGLVALGAQRIVCAPLPIGSGMVETAHGRYPLPAPATIELLTGWPLLPDRAQVELLTPTGAAIVAEVATPGALPEMTLEKIGYGVGSRDLADRPNLLRGLLGQAAEVNRLERDTVTVIESHIDDSTPEVLGYLLERLLASGALDAAYTPLLMKKGRPGVRLTVLAKPEKREELARLILRESSAIGVRFSTCERRKLRRESGTVTTDLGEAQVKLLYDGEELLRVAPEYESCRTLALTSGKPLAEVMRLVEEAGNQGNNRSHTEKSDDTDPI